MEDINFGFGLITFISIIWGWGNYQLRKEAEQNKKDILKDLKFWQDFVVQRERERSKKG